MPKLSSITVGCTSYVFVINNNKQKTLHSFFHNIFEFISTTVLLTRSVCVSVAYNLVDRSSELDCNIYCRNRIMWYFCVICTNIHIYTYIFYLFILIFIYYEFIVLSLRCLITSLFRNITIVLYDFNISSFNSFPFFLSCIYCSCIFAYVQTKTALWTRHVRSFQPQNQSEPNLLQWFSPDTLRFSFVPKYVILTWL